MAVDHQCYNGPMNETLRDLRALKLWLLLGSFIDWDRNDFTQIADEAKKIGRGLSPEEADKALRDLNQVLTEYLARV